MDNQLHLIWQIQKEHQPEDVQRNFLKFTAKTIKRDLKRNHPAVIERFLVNAKDRKYKIWEGNSLDVDLLTKAFVQEINYIPVRLVISVRTGTGVQHYNSFYAGVYAHPEK